MVLCISLFVTIRTVFCGAKIAPLRNYPSPASLCPQFERRAGRRELPKRSLMGSLRLVYLGTNGTNDLPVSSVTRSYHAISLPGAAF